MTRAEELLDLTKKITVLRIKAAKDPEGLSAHDKVQLQTLVSRYDTLNSSIPLIPDSNIPSIPDSVAQKSVETQTASMSPVKSIQYIQYPDLNILEYINATIKLNPWQRERPCDTDLKNLLPYVGKELDNHSNVLSSLIDSITSVTD